MGSQDALSVVHQDPWLLVVEKPAGLLTQPGLGPDQADSLITRLHQEDPGLSLVHRLDRDTSGLLLVARSPEVVRVVSGMFASRRVSKLYVADVQGVPPGRGGRVDLPLARLQRFPPRYGFHPAGRPSCTRWRQMKKAPIVNNPHQRLWLQPLTGRSHQLRAHLAALGMPIVGDPIYALDPSTVPSGRMHLHATALSLLHPFTGERLRCRSAVPF